ncbi:MAG TPA: hypothetical protein VFF52_14575 [Isosphaeraceae bacterium]|nr:hypothetical protein [Isosphaeraceae bacterium]
MVQQNPPGGAAHKSDPEIAAADGLFQDDPAQPSAQAEASPVLPSGSGDVFDLVDSPGSDEGAPASTSAAPETASAPKAAPARPREAPARRAEDRSRREPEVLVEEVWSRQAEWGPTLLVLAAWLLAVLLVLYFTWGNELYAIGFFAFLIGGAVAVVLSYPILITLERPVRITPEQAVRDFYAALSHHVPHYRRMWLLLSTAGRITAAYGSFEGFKAYWIERIQALKGSQAGPMTPLVFEVADYHGDKSAGQSRVEVHFTLKIFIRGRRQDGPIASLPAQLALVRGPDKMWYLENGTLPRAGSAATADRR